MKKDLAQIFRVFGHDMWPDTYTIRPSVRMYRKEFDFFVVKIEEIW